jgi:hypothetical protein
MSCGPESTPSNSLFRSPQLPQTGAWTPAGEAVGTPFHHIHLNNDYWLIVHTAPHGFTIVDSSTAQATDSVDYSTVASSESNFVTLQNLGIRNPAGAALVGGYICVAVSNPNAAPPPTFNTGGIIFTPYNGDGTVSVGSTTALLTSGFYPSGVVQVSNDQIAVLSSNTYEDNPLSDAWLDVCTVPNGPCSSTSLGQIHAQNIPTLALADGGARVLIGLLKPSMGFEGINWSNGAVSYPQTALNIIEGISSVNSMSDLALITSAGMYDDVNNMGALLIHNMGSGWQGTLETELPGKGGPSVVVGSTHYSGVNVNESGNPAGKIYTADLSGL